MCGFGISRQPRGAALVIVMLVMAVLLLAGTAFLTISSTESQIALNEQGSAAAHVLAEAGIHKALFIYNAQYTANPYRQPTYTLETNTALGGGTFTVSVTPVAGCLYTANVLSTGSVPIRGGTAQAQLQVTLDQVSYPYRWGLFAVTGDRSGQELLIGHTSSVDSFDSGAGPYDAATNSGKSGNVGANGDVEIDYNSTIGGNVTAGDKVTLGTGVTVSGGPPTQNAPTQSFPSVTPPRTGTTSLTVTSGTHTLSAGTYYYTNMTLWNNTTLSTSGGPVTIYVTNTYGTVVSLGTNVTLGNSPGSQLTIITRSDLWSTQYVTFTAGDNFQFYGSLYGTSTNITLGNNAKIYGSMLGRRVTTGSGAAVHFDQAMSNQAVCNPGGNFTILRGTWREIIPST